MPILDALPRVENDVRVRPLEHRDATGFAEGTRDPAVREFGHLPLPEYTEQVVRDQIDGVIADGLQAGTLAVLAIADERTDDFLGSVVLFDIAEDGAEVGFWLAPWARGRGAAQRALHAVAGLAGDLGLRRLDARTVVGNAASRRVLDGAGFRQVGGPREEVTPSGVAATVVTFRRSVPET